MFGPDDRNPSPWGETSAPGSQRRDDQAQQSEPDQLAGQQPDQLAGQQPDQLAGQQAGQLAGQQPDQHADQQPEWQGGGDATGQADTTQSQDVPAGSGQAAVASDGASVQAANAAKQGSTPHYQQAEHSGQPIQTEQFQSIQTSDPLQRTVNDNSATAGTTTFDQSGWSLPGAQLSQQTDQAGQVQRSDSQVQTSEFKGYFDSSVQPGQSQAGQTQTADMPSTNPDQSWYGNQSANARQAEYPGQTSYQGQGAGWGQASYRGDNAYGSRIPAGPDQQGRQYVGAGRPSTTPSTQWSQPFAPAPTITSTHKRAKKQGPGWVALIIAMVLTALVAGGGAAFFARHYADRQDDASAAAAAASSASQTEETTVPQVTSEGDSPDWQAVANAVGPAVVTINVSTQSAQAVGSGVVYDQAGHIVTNYHVISAAATDQSGQITVTLSNGSLYEATVVGYDQTTDLAVITLQNPPSDLTVARFGSSADVTVGQNVMAIGAPLGLSNTVTTGVISALDRPVEVSTSDSGQQQEVDPNDPFGQLERNQQGTAVSDSVITNAIQVDASINPGNSGGPLFDQTGAVIGINSSIASMSSSESEAGSIGLGFAIPSDLVKNVADQLIATGTANHGVLGVTIQDGTATVDGSTRVGAKVVNVNSGSGAEEAGIQQNDVILSVGGKQVVGSKSLTGFIRTYQAGDKVELEVVRDGSVQTIQATLQAASN